MSAPELQPPEITAAPAAAPPAAPAPSGRHRQEWLLLLAIILIGAGLDQWSKGWAVERLGPLTRNRSGYLAPPPGRQPVELIPGAFRAAITGNEGAIWGLGRELSAKIKKPVFVLMPLVAIVFILLLIRSSLPNQFPRRIGLAMVLAGALGNFIDRLAHDYVVDFLDWYLWVDWPTFNIADVAISVGVGLVFVDLWWHPDPIEEPEEKAPKAATQGTDAAPADGASRGEDVDPKA